MYSKQVGIKDSAVKVSPVYSSILGSIHYKRIIIQLLSSEDYSDFLLRSLYFIVLFFINCFSFFKMSKYDILKYVNINFKYLKHLNLPRVREALKMLPKVEEINIFIDFTLNTGRRKALVSCLKCLQNLETCFSGTLSNITIH